MEKTPNNTPIELSEILKIKVGTTYCVSQIGLYVGLLGCISCVLFFVVAVLLIGSFMPPEMTFIYYDESVYENVGYGFGLSILITFIGFWMSDLRIWTPTDLVIETGRIEFYKSGEKVVLPRQKIRKFVKLKSYFMKDRKVQIRTIGLKRYVIRIDNTAYQKLTDMYSDIFYKK